MYQNSLTYVSKLFNNAILSQMKVTEGNDEKERQDLLTRLVNEITLQLYEKICFGLFEQHKLVYAFIISTSISKDECKLDLGLWDLFLRGAGIFDKSEMPVKPENLPFISDASWELIYQIDNFSRMNTGNKVNLDSSME